MMSDRKTISLCLQYAHRLPVLLFMGGLESLGYAFLKTSEDSVHMLVQCGGLGLFASGLTLLHTFSVSCART